MENLRRECNVIIKSLLIGREIKPIENTFIDNVTKLFIEKLKDTPREIHLPTNTKCFVVGDIHGDIESMIMIVKFALMTYEASGGDIKVIFLGDYVDRGSNGKMVLLFLMSLKIVYPEVFIFLRGNHEEVKINLNGGFFKELEENENVFKMFTSIYEYLPIACVIENRYYCVHGGVPAYIVKGHFPKDFSNYNQQINKNVPVDIRKELHMLIALWNDPMDDNDYDVSTVCSSERGGLSFKFGKKYTDIFCKVKNVQAVIRAHEFKPGSEFSYTPDIKVFTVFSSINYGLLGGIKNDSAIVYINDKYEMTNGRVTDMFPIIFKKGYTPLPNPYDAHFYKDIKGLHTFDILDRLYGIMYNQMSVFKCSIDFIDMRTTKLGSPMVDIPMVNIPTVDIPMVDIPMVEENTFEKIPLSEMHDVRTKVDNIESDEYNESDIRQDDSHGLERDHNL